MFIYLNPRKVEMNSLSYLSNVETGYLDSLYNEYKTAPETIDESWQKFFEGFDFHKDFSAGDNDNKLSDKELNVYQLIVAYRGRAHLKSLTNPIRPRRDRKALLDLQDFGLEEADLETLFHVGSHIGIGPAKLKDIIHALEDIYMQSIGFEYLYIRNPNILSWFQAKVEKNFLKYTPTDEEKKRILFKLNEAVVFENFLHTKYIGQKRFSLEGGENLIPALDFMINEGAKTGAEEVIIAMAHRGRLNVLANIVGKTYKEIFYEFEGAAVPDQTMGNGDVKYHLGYSSRLKTTGGSEVRVELVPNPSHLEAVDPVLLGYCRAKIHGIHETDTKKVIPIMIHGDAAIAGQGIIYEIAQMSGLPAYDVGGTIHFIINNQLGFTTNFEDARSSIYCTDIAKIVDSPVIHVNGDDPEAVIYAVQTAIEYRQTFQKDIYIDMLCYRKYGHNEGDEPRFTQPDLYKLIAKHPNPREVYNKKLIERGDVDAQLAKSMEKEFKSLLQDRLDEVKENPVPVAYKKSKFEEGWAKLRRSTPDDFEFSPETAVSKEIINIVAKALCTLPDGFKPIKQIEKLIQERKTMLYESGSINWAAAELMAYGTMLLENTRVRICGQDVQRGTFSHRHAVVRDAETNEAHCNLDHMLEDQQVKLKIHNSLLSEYGALGYEFGFSLANPNSLTIWEAQFGDFSNGAQVIIDQFIMSSETKWQRNSGMVLLLPHGYEGQGPEHSSARLERFLQQCADYNVVVANITSPANFFHALRRQLNWQFRKPLFVMTPKSLLRNPKVVSPLEDFTSGSFQEIIDDPFVDVDKVNRVLFCSGKVYYDLLAEQQVSDRKDVAVVRLEQLYPVPCTQLEKIIAKYCDAEIYWVQEEPENMGAWYFFLNQFRYLKPKLISRPASSSPAVGLSKVHHQAQKELIEKAFGLYSYCELLPREKVEEATKKMGRCICDNL